MSALDHVTEQALGLTTAAALLDQTIRTVGALCYGVTDYGFDREVTRDQLVSLSQHLLPAVDDWIVSSPRPDGNLAGLDVNLASVTTDLDALVHDIGTILAYGADLPDDWHDQLNEQADEVVGVVRKVQAALTLADAPINGSRT